jgi:hypothetical protein
MSNFSNRAQEYASLPDLGWLTGIWIGSNGDQYFEEHWSQAVADQLMGMFRMLESGKPVFYEFMTIGLEGNSVSLSIKHFNPGLVGWEDKDQAVTYDLVQQLPHELVFFKRQSQDQNWMVYRQVGDRLQVFFVGSEGEVDGSRFEFERKA